MLGVVSLVLASLFELPLSLALSSVVVGALGAVVSSTYACEATVPVLPAESVTRTFKVLLAVRV